MPYRSTKVMLSLAANAAARTATAAERARLNLSPNAEAFTRIEGELQALLIAEGQMAINQAALPPVLRDDIVIPTEAPVAEVAPAAAEVVAEAATPDLDSLPSGEASEAEEVALPE